MTAPTGLEQPSAQSSSPVLGSERGMAADRLGIVKQIRKGIGAARLGRTAYRLTLRGEYDLNRKIELDAEFAKLVPNRHVIIDLLLVTYVDSGFLSALALLRFRLKPWKVALVNVTPPVLRVLQVARYDELFEITPAAALGTELR